MVLVVSRCFLVAPPSRGPVVQWSRCPVSASAFLPSSIFPPLLLPLCVSVSLWFIAYPCHPWSIVREMAVGGIFCLIPLPNIPLPAKSLPFQGCSVSAALRVFSDSAWSGLFTKRTHVTFHGSRAIGVSSAIPKRHCGCKRTQVSVFLFPAQLPGFLLSTCPISALRRISSLIQP